MDGGEWVEACPLPALVVAPLKLTKEEAKALTQWQRVTAPVDQPEAGGTQSPSAAAGEAVASGMPIEEGNGEGNVARLPPYDFMKIYRFSFRITDSEVFAVILYSFSVLLWKSGRC